MTVLFGPNGYSSFKTSCILFVSDLSQLHWVKATATYFSETGLWTSSGTTSLGFLEALLSGREAMWGTPRGFLEGSLFSWKDFMTHHVKSSWGFNRVSHGSTLNLNLTLRYVLLCVSWIFFPPFLLSPFLTLLIVFKFSTSWLLYISLSLLKNCILPFKKKFLFYFFFFFF